MRFEIKIGKENADAAITLAFFYYILLSIVVMIKYNLSVFLWALLIGLIPYLISKLTKIKIRRIE